nr:MAG TPA: hypothetical protein [Caudoviricetes sp.]
MLHQLKRLRMLSLVLMTVLGNMLLVNRSKMNKVLLLILILN